jgi:hypothetical protein
VAASAADGRLLDVVDGSERTAVDVVLQWGGAKVAGVVVDGLGGPVPHAALKAERTMPPRAAVDIEADEMGRFALWFPPGPMMLSAQAPAYAASRWYGPAPSRDIRLMLMPGATIRGVVVSSADAAALANVDVRAVSAEGSSTLQANARTGPHGEFEIRGLEPGSYRLVATGEAVRGELPHPIGLALGATVENIRVEVGAAAAITGRVLQASARLPCEDGQVLLGGPDPTRVKPERRGRAAGGFPKAEFAATIGPGGLVHFPAVTQGHYDVTVRCRHSVLRSGPPDLDVGLSTLSDLTWTVGPGLSLEIRTVGERDEPVPDVPIFVSFPGGLQMAARSDGEGKYQLSGDLYAGTYEISPGAPLEGGPVQVVLRDADGPITAKVRIAAGASIQVSVRERGGGSVDGLTISALGQSLETRANGPPPTPFLARALGDGRYRIAPLKPGRYEVRVDDGTNAAIHASYVLAAGETLQADLEIERAGRIRGHVVDDNGMPVSDVWVSAAAIEHSDLPRQVLGSARRVLTDLEGRFDLDRLAGGDTTYAVRVDQPAGSSALKPGVKADGSYVTIRLPAPGSVEGMVVGDCGPSGGAVGVQVINRETGQSSSQEVSSPGGAFHLAVAPGPVKVLALCRNGLGLATTTVDALPGNTVAGLRLALKAPSGAGQEHP